MSTNGIQTGDVVFCLAIVAMVACSLWFGSRIDTAAVPMQWGVDGKPTWFAPKLLGLWFFVGLALLVRVIFYFQVDADGVRKAAQGLITFSVVIATVHAGYLIAILRWASKQS